MTPADCIRAALPDADDALCHHIIWGRTPFPFEKLSARDFYKAASGFKRANDNGLRLCDHCHNVATADKWTCRPCYDALHQPHPDRLALTSKPQGDE